MEQEEIDIHGLGFQLVDYVKRHIAELKKQHAQAQAPEQAQAIEREIVAARKAIKAAEEDLLRIACGAFSEGLATDQPSTGWSSDWAEEEEEEFGLQWRCGRRKAYAQHREAATASAPGQPS